MVPDAGVDCSGCPLLLGNAPCHTLQYYAANSNFTSNAVFHFLEGEHALDTVVKIANVANLSLVGVNQDSSKVLCGPSSAGFFVENFDNLSVENLSFLNCSGSAYIPRRIHTVKWLQVEYHPCHGIQQLRICPCSRLSAG